MGSARLQLEAAFSSLQQLQQLFLDSFASRLGANTSTISLAKVAQEEAVQ